MTETQTSTKKCQGYLCQGYLLVESMVALAIFSIAILGLAAGQISASKNNLSALLKTETAISMAEIIDMMKSNLTGVANGDYDSDDDKAHKINNPVDTQADEDINIWLTSLEEAAKGMAPSLKIKCTGKLRLDCTLTLDWSDARAATDLENTKPDEKQFSFRTQVFF